MIDEVVILHTFEYGGWNIVAVERAHGSTLHAVKKLVTPLDKLLGRFHVKDWFIETCEHTTPQEIEDYGKKYVDWVNGIER